MTTATATRQDRTRTSPRICAQVRALHAAGHDAHAIAARFGLAPALVESIVARAHKVERARQSVRSEQFAVALTELRRVVHELMTACRNNDRPAEIRARRLLAPMVRLTVESMADAGGNQ